MTILPSHRTVQLKYPDNSIQLTCPACKKIIKECRTFKKTSVIHLACLQYYLTLDIFKITSDICGVKIQIKTPDILSGRKQDNMLAGLINMAVKIVNYLSVF